MVIDRYGKSKNVFVEKFALATDVSKLCLILILLRLLLASVIKLEQDCSYQGEALKVPTAF